MVQFEKMVVQHKRQSIVSIHFPAAHVTESNRDSSVVQTQLQIDEAEMMASIERDHEVIKELEVDAPEMFKYVKFLLKNIALNFRTTLWVLIIYFQNFTRW